MNIQTVKELESSYLVNNLILVPKDPVNKDYKKVQTWINEGGIVEPEFTEEELLKNAQDKKKTEINTLRDHLLNLDSPHTVGATYILELNGEQVRFQVNQSTKTDLIANIIDLQDEIDSGEVNPTSDWIAVDNQTYQLTISDFKELIKHLKYRAECLYKNARTAKDAILDMDNIEDIKDYDINWIAIYG